MEKNDKGSVYQDQKANKPRIGDMIDTYLGNDLKTAAVDFVEFIKSQKMTPQWYAADSFSVSYRNKRVCIIKMQAGSWWIWSYTRYDGGFDSCLADESAEIKKPS